MINKLVFIDDNDTETQDYAIARHSDFGRCIIAGSGYSAVMQHIDYLLQEELHSTEPVVLVTNSLDVFANTKIKFAINDFSKYYIVQENGVEKPITELYGTNIRPINALDKMYKAGVFGSGVYTGKENEK